jgi:phenylpropionate dioxygenase-like ring-hydroxylating dioxygenase large terminal subunit
MPFATTTETGVPIQGPSATLIYDDWYPALRTSALGKGKLTRAMLLDLPLVLGRLKDGRVFAMRDSCPHRGIPLSVGWYDGTRVTCRYHGWEFEPCSGQCAHIPSLSSFDHLDATRIYATAFPCEERDGHAWVYVPGPGAGRKSGTTELRPVPELAKFGTRYRTAHLWADLPCNVDHGIIGLMDPAHGPFVHQAWWWRTRSSIREKTKRFEPIPEGFRMSAHKPSGNSAPYKLLGVYGKPVETTIDFQLPNRGDAGDQLDVPHRRDRGVECFLLDSVRDADREVLWRDVCPPGPGDDDPASRWTEAQSEPDAD